MRVVHHLVRTLARIKCGEVEVTCKMCGLQLLSTFRYTILVAASKCCCVLVCGINGGGSGAGVFVCGM